MDSVIAEAPTRPRGQHSGRLRLTIQLAAPRIDALSRRFWNDPRLAALFPEYLLTLYASMRATVPLLEAGAERARTMASDDPVAAALVPYFLEHAREELHHDDWLLEDMALLGMDSSLATSRHAPPDVAAMIGAQYYWMHYSHPISLLGCFAVLEGSPPEVEVLDDVASRTGLPREALRTLYKHALLDPHHRDDLDAVLDDLPLAPEHSAILGISALTVMDQLGGILERLLAAEPRAEG
ncbi:MAG: iron-containing redox enzyme family protein [Gemmatimonadales bacterium]